MEPLNLSHHPGPAASFPGHPSACHRQLSLGPICEWGCREDGVEEGGHVLDKRWQTVAG